MTGRHTSDVVAPTLIELERACADLRLLGAPDDASVRLRTRPAWNAAGGHPRSITGEWQHDADHNTASPDARPMFKRGAAGGPVDK